MTIKSVSYNIVHNAKAVAKNKGLSIGDLETELNLSLGYLSRCGTPDAKRRISADAAYKLALYLGFEDDTAICDFFFRDISRDYEIETLETDILALEDELESKKTELRKLMSEKYVDENVKKEEN